jgi:hypothetical protein
MFGSATGGDGGAQAAMTANVNSIDITIRICFIILPPLRRCHSGTSEITCSVFLASD